VDIRKVLTARTFKDKKGRTVSKRPKLQRLVTPLRLQRKRALLSDKRQAREKAQKDKAEYVRLRKVRATEQRASVKARRSSRKSSKKAVAVAAAPATA